jgi:hypothetical protein
MLEHAVDGECRAVEERFVTNTSKTTLMTFMIPLTPVLDAGSHTLSVTSNISNTNFTS